VLERLSDAYATAVDRRDLAALRDCFLPDGRLVTVSGARPPRVYEGHEGLAEVMTELEPFAVTAHHVTTRHIVLDAEDGEDGGSARARGRVACVAHHVSAAADGGASDLIFHIAYEDAYARGADGRWRISERIVRVLFSERRPVRLP